MNFASLSKNLSKVKKTKLFISFMFFFKIENQIHQFEKYRLWSHLFKNIFLLKSLKYAYIKLKNSLR